MIDDRISDFIIDSIKGNERGRKWVGEINCLSRFLFFN